MRTGPLLTIGQVVVVIIAILAVAAAIIAAVTLVPPAVRVANPELPVRAYLQAIVKGDITKAMKIGRITADADDKLLTDAAYGQASDRITSFTVLETTVSGTTGAVSVRIAQGDHSYVTGFDIARASANPFEPWRLAKQQLPAISLRLQAQLDVPLRIGGVDFAVAGGSLTQRVFPGSYETSPRESGAFDVGYATATATFDAARPAPVRVPVGLTEAGKASADAAVNAWLTTCIASTELHPEGCPFQAVPEASVTYSNGRWTIQRQPQFALGDWSDQAEGWPVTPSSPGYVTFSARAREGGLTGTATTGSNPFSVAGTIVPDASGALHFTPSANYSSPGAAGSLT